MIFPDRLNRYEDSVLYVMYRIVEILSKESMEPKKLYNIIKNDCSIKVYREALDYLYMINMLEYNDEGEVLKYVDGN